MVHYTQLYIRHLQIRYFSVTVQKQSMYLSNGYVPSIQNSEHQKFLILKKLYNSKTGNSLFYLYYYTPCFISNVQKNNRHTCMHLEFKQKIMGETRCKCQLLAVRLPRHPSLSLHLAEQHFYGLQLWSEQCSSHAIPQCPKGV